jgi:hypothetical protein
MKIVKEDYIQAEKIFWDSRDIKSPARFICNIVDEKTNSQIIPSYVIHTIERPTYVWIDNNRIWNNISIVCYETIGDNILMKINSATKFTVCVKELYSDGNVAEEWDLIGCRFENVYPSPLSWQKSSDVLSVTATIKYSSIRVNTNIKK